MSLLAHLLSRFVRNGRLTVIHHDGSRESFGSGENGPDVEVKLHDAKVQRQLFLNPELASAEAYMDGRLTIENGKVLDLLTLFSVNRAGLGSHPVQQALRKVWRVLKRRHQSNRVGQAAANVSSHYDHPRAFYEFWLDETMSYSCAYFERPDMGLKDAQIAKMRHIAAKLRLEPGMTVAEIGSGWGGLATYLAAVCGARVTAINVSPDQLAASKDRVARAGLADRITFFEKDYRELTGTFDRVVSVGMMEHVGVAHFDDYFATVKRLCGTDGYAMIHAIGRMSPPGTTAPFIRKYIFPGGYVPALSEVFASTERVGLWVDDCEVLRLHYYWTIRAWREKFEAVRDQVVAMQGERFARMWEFYLAAVELGFRDGSNMVYQLLLSEKRDAVPVTRDFITQAEQTLKEREGVLPWQGT